MKPDPFGYIEELNEALHQPELKELEEGSAEETKDQRVGALWLAVALGKVRLAGLDAGDLDGVLPTKIAVAAAKQLRNEIWELTLLAEELEDAYKIAVADPLEGREEVEDKFILWPLERRMDFWAASVSLEEASADAVEKSETLSPILERLEPALKALDAALLTQTSLLCQIAAYECLANWRKMLGPAFAKPLPWWLDGRLEALYGAQGNRN